MKKLLVLGLLTLFAVNVVVAGQGLKIKEGSSPPGDTSRTVSPGKM